MPTTSTTRRSQVTPRGGTLSSTRRSASRAVDLNRGAAGQGAQFAAAAARDAPGRTGFSPLGTVLDVLSTTGRGVGKVIDDPKGSLSYSLVDAYRDPNPVTAGRALERRGALDFVPDRYGLRTGAKFVIDVGTDPLTFVTGGGATAARTAGVSASRGLAGKAARGEQITLDDVARASYGENAARQAIPRTLSIGLQVPFTRAKRLVLAESEAIPAAASRLGRLVTTEGMRDGARRNVAGNFAPAAGTDKGVYKVGRDVANFASTQKRDVSRAATQYQKQLDRALRSAGMTRIEGYRAIAFAAEQPEKYASRLPESLLPFVERLRAELDAYDVAEQIAGIEKASVPGYIPHRLLNTAERRRFERQFGGTASLDNPFFVKERTFPHIEAGEAAGFKFEVNPARLLEVRGHASIEARAKKAFDTEIAARRGAIDVPDAPPADWTPGSGEGGTATVAARALDTARSDWAAYPSKYLSDTRIDPDTREAVLRVHEQITPKMTSDAGVESVKRLANTVTARWKSLALGTPGFHLRNLYSDMMVATWAGARNPKSYIDAGKIVAGKGRNVKLTVDGERLDGEGILSLAKALGIIDQGFSSKEVAAGLSDTAGSIRKATTKVRAPGTGRWVQTSRKAGDFRENAVRIGTFIERVKAGDSAYEAARAVRQWHMDYGDVGKFVEGARRFWTPFITYSAKALPLVAHTAVQRPGRLATMDKAFNALNEAAGSPDLSLLAPGQRSSFAVPVPEGFETFLGGTPGQPVLYNPEKTFAPGVLNTFDPTQIKASLVSGLGGSIPKAMWELPTGYRFYTSRQAPLRQRAPFLVQWAAENVPGAGEFLDYGLKRYQYRSQTVPGYGATGDYLLRMFPPFSQSSGLVPSDGGPSVMPGLGSYLFGVRLSPYDRARDAYYARLYGDRR